MYLSVKNAGFPGLYGPRGARRSTFYLFFVKKPQIIEKPETFTQTEQLAHSHEKGKFFV